MKAKALVGLKNCTQAAFFEILEITIIVIVIQDSLNQSASALSSYQKCAGI